MAPNDFLVTTVLRVNRHYGKLAVVSGSTKLSGILSLLDCASMQSDSNPWLKSSRRANEGKVIWPAAELCDKFRN